MPRTQAAKSQVASQPQKECKRASHEVICLEDNSMSGHCYNVSKTVVLPNHEGCKWQRDISQEPIYVKQKDVKILVKEGCNRKRQDEINVDVKLKPGKVCGPKIDVHVKKPKVHVQPQKVHVEVIKGKKACDKPKVHVRVDKPCITVDQPEVKVRCDKGQCVTAPEPIICVTHRKAPCTKKSLVY